MTMIVLRRVTRFGPVFGDCPLRKPRPAKRGAPPYAAGAF